MHPPTVGVTLYTNCSELAVLFTMVIDGIDPPPLGVKPNSPAGGLTAFHVYVVPATSALSETEVLAPPLQTVWLPGDTKTGVGLTLNV